MVVAEDPPASVKRLLIEFARAGQIAQRPQREAEVVHRHQRVGVSAPRIRRQALKVPGQDARRRHPPPRRRARARARHGARRLPGELPAHLADELAELLKDAERYAAAAQDTDAGAPGSENNPPLDRLPRMEARLGALSNTFR